MNTPAQCGVIKPPKTDIYSEAPQNRSAKPASKASNEPANNASTTIAPTTTTNPTTRQKLVNFPDQPPRCSQTHVTYHRNNNQNQP